MTLINLTQRHLELSNSSLYKKFKLLTNSHLYYASSIPAMFDGLKQNPPKGKKFLGMKSAYVLLENINIQILNSAFDETDRVSLKGLDDGMTFPWFWLEDKIGTRTVAGWMAGNSTTYTNKKEEFGFNENSYVEIPELYLKYMVSQKGGDYVAILSLRSPSIPQQENKKETLAEKIDKLAINLLNPLPTI